MDCGKSLLLIAVTTFLVACSPQSPEGSADVVAQAPFPSSDTSAKDAPQPTATSNAQADSSTQLTKGGASMLRNSFDECIKASGGVVPEMQACIESEFEYQDGRLNVAYQRLREALGVNEKAELELKQKQWLKERDAQCGWDADEEGQGQRLEANDCFLEMTSKRADELEAIGV